MTHPVENFPGFEHLVELEMQAWAEEVLDWSARSAGQSVPKGDYLAFVKEHFWKLPGVDGQQNVSGNYRVMCKRCGKGPVVWPTTRLKAHVIGEIEFFTCFLLCN